MFFLVKAVLKCNLLILFYKIDEGSWKDSPIFNDVSRGEHKATVRDTKSNAPFDYLVIEGTSP